MKHCIGILTYEVFADEQASCASVTNPVCLWQHGHHVASWITYRIVSKFIGWLFNRTTYPVKLDVEGNKYTLIGEWHTLMYCNWSKGSPPSPD